MVPPDVYKRPAPFVSLRAPPPAGFLSGIRMRSSTITCAGIRHSLLRIALSPSPESRFTNPVGCEAQRGIHRQFSTRLSSPGCFLCAASACYLFLSSLLFMKLLILYEVFSYLSTVFGRFMAFTADSQYFFRMCQM